MGSSEVLTGVARALTIAGSDSGGGAGIQADLKTFLALGAHGMSAIVALTAQNTTGVSAIHDVPIAFIREQIFQVASDIGVDALKTGMLSKPDVIETVATSIQELGLTNVVVDPVFVSKNGDKLLEDEAVGTLTTKLFPLALIVTPNLHEAHALTGVDIEDMQQMREAAKRLFDMGPANVLVKGGHLAGDAVDILYDGVSFQEFTSPRVDSIHTHGTGCTLSAAIAAEVAKGNDLVEAIDAAKKFVFGAISHGLAIGKGYGPTNHGWDSTLKWANVK